MISCRALAACVSLAASVAHADVLLSNYPPTNDTGTTADVDNLRKKALSFALPGASPAYNITQITLRLQNYVTPADVAVLEIRDHTGSTTAPGTTVLGTFTAPTSAGTAVGDFVFTPTSGITLMPGTSYWIVLGGADTVTSFDWRGSSPSVTPTGIATYGGQSLFTTNNGTSWTSSATINTFNMEGVPAGGSFGACCLGAPSYSCIVSTPTGCASQGGTYAGDNVTCAAANCPPPPTGACCAEDGTCSVVTQAVCLAAGSVYQGDNSACTGQCVAFAYIEANGPEAGELTTSAVFVTGPSTNPLLRIRGTFQASDMDMYAIQICDEANFSATTAGGTTADTQLFLFDASGRGVVMGDDNVAPLPVSNQSTITSQFVNSNGLYFLAVGAYNRDPVDGTTTTTQLLWNNTNPGGAFGPEWAPNGPGAANPVAGWTGTFTSTVAYAINMTGTCFVSGTFGACCLGSPSYSCMLTTQTACVAAGGTYAGDNVACASANCPPPPTGACCKADGSCEILTASQCVTAAGTYAGDNVTCAAANCPQPGACCLPNFVCNIVQQSACVAAGGTFQGAGSACGTCPSVPAGSVAIYAADAVASVNDVQAKLQATGLFPAVVTRVITTPAATPTLSDLQQFKAVLIFSNSSFSSGAALGDVMADYIDAGGGVVNCVFSVSTTTANRFLAGRWDSSYQIIPQGGGNTSTGGEQSLGTIVVPGHPILNSVATFSGGNSSFRPTSTALTAHGQLVAQWTDGKTLIATSSTRPRRVDLGMFPPSTTVTTTGWNATTDGARLMANALLYAGRNLCYADCDGVGGLTANDFACFLTAYSNGASYADCDGVGGLTANDFACFLTAYTNGCP